MTDFTLRDGTKNSTRAQVTSDNRLAVDALVASYSQERSLKGQLFITGTGLITVTSGMSLAPVLWVQNTAATQDMLIQKIIFGWNGGSTNFNRTSFNYVTYNTTEPTTNIATANDQIENISLSGSNTPVSSGKTLAWKWDGGGSNVGMTGGSGGFVQRPHTVDRGNTSIEVDGETILGPGNSVEIQTTPGETGLYHVSIVLYFVPLGVGRSGI